MINAALIDIGNVLLTTDFENSLKRLIPSELADPEARIHSLLERKDELEGGQMTMDDFIEWASKKLGYEGPKEDFLVAWNDIFEPIAPMWETIRDLKGRGIKLYLFSNTNQAHADYFLSTYETLFQLFDGRIFSYEIDAVKPDPAIYHHAFEKYSLKPEETLYIDDLPENISTGLQLSLHSWRYNVDSHEAMTRWLVEVLD
ncbi:MAG: HAD family phosphatase [Verrucomicrobiota bacterium JB023]|nr:HAD family phosphatase [Verrucomicrobiota bacterium JB023]